MTTTASIPKEQSQTPRSQESKTTSPEAPRLAPAAPAAPPEPRLDRIARRAHEIYEARGGEHGKDLQDWLQAEREIDAEIERQADDRAGAARRR